VTVPPATAIVWLLVGSAAAIGALLLGALSLGLVAQLRPNRSRRRGATWGNGPTARPSALIVMSRQRRPVDGPHLVAAVLDLAVRGHIRARWDPDPPRTAILLEPVDAPPGTLSPAEQEVMRAVFAVPDTVNLNQLRPNAAVVKQHGRRIERALERDGTLRSRVLRRYLATAAFLGFLIVIGDLGLIGNVAPSVDSNFDTGTAVLLLMGIGVLAASMFGLMRMSNVDAFRPRRHHPGDPPWTRTDGLSTATDADLLRSLPYTVSLGQERNWIALMDERWRERHPDPAVTGGLTDLLAGPRPAGEAMRELLDRLDEALRPDPPRLLTIGWPAADGQGPAH
jgi:hypothetical protein